MTDAKRKSVCIVGGGPSGLVSLRRVLESEFLTGTLFEQKDDIGGVWYYKQGQKQFPASSHTMKEKMSGKLSREPHPECTSTMYDDLTCNLPHPLMEFQDFPHDNPPRTYLTQPEVHQYLRQYSTHFKLGPAIQLNTSVIGIRPETPITEENLGTARAWLVTTHNLKTDLISTTRYDAVMVCVGKHSYPYNKPMLAFEGLDSFQGKVFHSKNFLNADQFKDSTVVIVGAGPSSADLALQLGRAAKSVIICHKFAGGFGLGLLPPNVRETHAVKNITPSGIVTDKDEQVDCDCIIFCTGFAINFPILADISDLYVVDEKYMKHLYKMTIYTKCPTLAILNLCYRSPEFLMTEVQAQYFVACLEGLWGNGHFKLPSYEVMEATVGATEEENKKEGVSSHLWFQVGVFGQGTWSYFKGMCDELGIADKVCNRWPLLENLIVLVFLKRIYGKLALYKKDKFRYIERDTVWEYICAGGSKELFPEVKGEKVILKLDQESGQVVTETVEQDEQCTQN